jgi:hypothetical protein
MRKTASLLVFLLFISCGAVKAQKTLTGTIVAVKGNVFTIKSDDVKEIPAKTDTVSVSKDISGTKNPFGITVKSGWMGVADAMFVSQKGNNLTFKITKETSSIVINGKKTVHFVNGKKMKIDWK